MFKAVIDQQSFISLLEARHADELFSVIDNSRDSIGQWLEFPDHTLEVDDTRKFIERSLARYASNNGYWAGIWHKGKIAGSIGFLYFNWNSKRAEIGYWLAKDYEGLGLVTRACSLMIDHAFEDLQLNKVEIGAAPNNERSRAIPERLGFKEEGTIRCFEYLHGEYLDRVTYGVLAEEWRGRSRNP